ncbi:fumarylacetoacetate hydrolase family protein [Undibacterium sp. TS12]|uniref:fumarylacetoacetate hydrolase family protein n=1 Tax=Undibacterium sp. TS12 TaxID=2908202 RepID=UPI001F4C810C|nr:fumarylacetoacetate hydrolase family protein [Undibacterium sp. TS12]MCH8622609.1 fumarylacetoacetate hydrolase family protein [Undibacterium sp. TS12]
MQTNISEESAAVQHAAAMLWQRRINGTQGSGLPDRCRPTSLPAAFAIQCELSRLNPQKIAAWKCGMPAEDKWVLAPIYAETVHDADSHHLHPVFSRNGKLKIEPEFAYVMARSLPARLTPYTIAEVDDAVACTRLALELIDTRYAQPEQRSFLEHLADGLFNQGLLLGPVFDDTADIADGVPIELAQDQVTVKSTGWHPAGNPRLPLYWLAEFLRSQGMGLEAGQAIITGSFAGSPEVNIHTPVEVSFGHLGKIRAGFESR